MEDALLQRCLPARRPFLNHPPADLRKLSVMAHIGGNAFSGVRERIANTLELLYKNAARCDAALFSKLNQGLGIRPLVRAVQRERHAILR